jgi:hypothetical protein
LMGELIQVYATDQFHRNETHAVRLTKLVSLDDVGMDQIGHKLGFTDEILDEHLLAREAWTDDFNGNAFYKITRAVLLAFIDDTHPALKNFAGDFVTKFVLDREQRHSLMLEN